MKSTNQKLKLLHLLKILCEKSDERHGLTVNEIIDNLYEYKIPAERKSIYDDIKCLISFGIDIKTLKGKCNRYYINNKLFNTDELKLLSDSVKSAKFISEEKSKELIEKSLKLISKYDADFLRNDKCSNIIRKTSYSNIYYNVSLIQRAIFNNRQIQFKYFDYNINKEKIYRKNGEFFKESPVSLIPYNENYYLESYDSQCEKISYYNLNRIEKIVIDSDLREQYKTDLNKCAVEEETEVELISEISLINIIFDKFGVDIPLTPINEKSFSFKIKINPGREFLSWILSFGNKLKIISPDSVKKNIKDLIEEGLNIYPEDLK